MAKSKKTTDDEIIRIALERYEYAQAEHAENRQAYLDDINFGRLGNQWPDDIAKIRTDAKRPMLTINKLPAFLRQVVNDSRLNKPSIKVRPVDDGADPETATTLQGLIRNIESVSNADIAYDTGIDNAASGGIGFIEVGMEYSHDDTFQKDIVIKPVENPQAVQFDPDTQAFDSSDWTFAFKSDQLSQEQFEAKWPKAEKVDFSAWDGGDGWFQEDGVRIAAYWDRVEYDKTLHRLSDGRVVDEDKIDDEARAAMAAQGVTPVQTRAAKGYKITHRIMSGVEVLEETEWVGSMIPLIPVYGEIVNYNGKRFWRSLIRDSKDAQRMNNYWRTASTEIVALAPKAPFIGPEKAFEGFEDLWENANTKSYAYLPYKGMISPQRQVFSSNVAAEIQEALLSGDDMKTIMGLENASLGIRSNETSGRAIRERKMEGDVSTYHFTDNLTRSIRGVGTVIVQMIPHVYTEDRIVRVLGDDGKAGMKRVNEPSTDKETGVDKILNDLTTGKYDITVEAGPSYTTRRQESADAMVEMIRVFPDAAPLLGDMVARAMDWPEADRVADRLFHLLPEPIKEADRQKERIESDEANVDMIMAQAQQEIAKRDQQIQEMQKDAEQIQKMGAEVQKQSAALNIASKDIEHEQGELISAKRIAIAELQALQSKTQASMQKKFFELENRVETMIASITPDQQAAMAGALDLVNQAMGSLDVSMQNMAAEAAQAQQEFLAVLRQPMSIQADPATGRPIDAARRGNGQ